MRFQVWVFISKKGKNGVVETEIESSKKNIKLGHEVQMLHWLGIHFEKKRSEDGGEERRG